MARVKDCPHCGGAAKVWTRTSFDTRVQKETTRTTVLCTECGCRTKACARPEDAIYLWNSRVGRVSSDTRPWWRRLLGA